MSTHTPGQWIRGGDAGNLKASKIFTVRQAGGELTLPIIAYVSKEENIPLIAAAPDLLEALEMVMNDAARLRVGFDLYTIDGDTLETVSAAIRKATGGKNE